MTGKRLSVLFLLWQLAACGGENPALRDVIPEEPIDNAEEPDAGVAPDLSAPDQAPLVPYAILSMQADPARLSPGGTVSLTAQVRNNGTTDLTDAQLWIEAKAPDGRLFMQKVTDLTIAQSATTPVTQLRGPYTVVGNWVFTPTLRDAAGTVLATGAAVTVPVGDQPDPATGLTNPLNGIAAYAQFNTSYTYGSCGSHSGAVAIAYLKGLRNDNDAALAIEHNLYNRLPAGPGEDSLKSAYNAYLKANGVPYRAVSIGSGSVLSSVKAGAPVVAHVYNHYVTIYGLTDESGTWYVYFSDGVTGYGTSGSSSIGAGGHLRKMSWSAFKGKMYGGYIGFSK